MDADLLKYGQVSTIALTEGVDLSTASEITDTMMSIRPTEWASAKLGINRL